MRPRATLAALAAAALLAGCQLTGNGSEVPEASAAPAAAPAPTTSTRTRSRTGAKAVSRLASTPQPPAPVVSVPEPPAPEAVTPEPPAPAPAPADPAPAQSEAPTTAPAPAPASPAPHVYMSLQPGGTGAPVSVIFAIDAARDNTPSDDPAIRLTPENGRCNPQEMRRYAFPPADAARPVVSEADQARGLTAARLPDFLAVAVTNRMLARGLATDREETRGLNICTRKLWERLVAAQAKAALSAGQ